MSMCFSVCPDAFVPLVLKLLSCCITLTLMLSLLLSKARLSCYVCLCLTDKAHVMHEL